MYTLRFSFNFLAKFGKKRRKVAQIREILTNTFKNLLSIMPKRSQNSMQKTARRNDEPHFKKFGIRFSTFGANTKPSPVPRRNQTHPLTGAGTLHQSSRTAFDSLPNAAAWVSSLSAADIRSRSSSLVVMIFMSVETARSDDLLSTSESPWVSSCRAASSSAANVGFPSRRLIVSREQPSRSEAALMLPVSNSAAMISPSLNRLAIPAPPFMVSFRCPHPAG